MWLWLTSKILTSVHLRQKIHGTSHSALLPSIQFFLLCLPKFCPIRTKAVSIFINQWKQHMNRRTSYTIRRSLNHSINDKHLRLFRDIIKRSGFHCFTYFAVEVSPLVRTNVAWKPQCCIQTFIFLSIPTLLFQSGSDPIQYPCLQVAAWLREWCHFQDSIAFSLLGRLVIPPWA